ncbi:hypothetical protein GEV33_002526 [Tenebrio molitor]|uniref:Uncharacterized protein n=1 Tax=Tenebrio molitor TaxID=7067 RepID=A0A8J6LFY4_TENMO|nr:hypothetical protein GEV33_002526 [Tenebrio molitor]
MITEKRHSEVDQLELSIIKITGLDKMLNGHAYSRAVRAHILTNLILAGIILDEVDLTGKERAETENKLRESERSLILFVKENRTYQSLRAKFKTALHNLEGEYCYDLNRRAISLECSRTHRNKNVHGLPPKNLRRVGEKAINRGNQGQKREIHGCWQCLKFMRVVGEDSSKYLPPPQIAKRIKDSEQGLHYGRLPNRTLLRIKISSSPASPASEKESAFHPLIILRLAANGVGRLARWVHVQQGSSWYD